MAWVSAYGVVADRVEWDRKCGLSQYPYEAGPLIGALSGVFLERKESRVRKALEKHSSMRAVAEYKPKYVNSVAYWVASHQSAIGLRQDNVEEVKFEYAKRLDVWEIVAVRYSLHVLGLRKEFCKMPSDDPTHAKL